ncbi:M13 family metallopeptidase [Canibacter oris]|uniref:Putative endopeptidase n=1 Tax=Canibacter oris TaxID=1365628 RepID=A0A840DRM1_9MICO|nr:M13-type metalloendopeptidase [Canibacter oris]MBB4072169.1 putative endopeptidase [Canibacter oris]
MTLSGINLAELDPAVRPQDDLYRHVNGKWIARTEIPADKARYGAFAMLAENAEEAVREIITGGSADTGAGTDTGAGAGVDAGAEAGADNNTAGDSTVQELEKIQRLYAAFMDEAELTRLGADPLQPELAEIDAVTNITEFTRLVARFDLRGAAGFAGTYVDNDPGDPQRYVLMLTQAGLGMPDESYYREAQFAEIREQYQRHIARMFELVGVRDAAARAARVFELETAIAAHHWDRVESRDIQKIYNLLSFAELCEAVPGIAWTDYFAELGLEEPLEVVLCQPSALRGFGQLLTEDRLEAWQDWLRWHVVASSSGLLSPEISAANFEFYGTALTGAEQQRPRWRRGVSFVEGTMGEAVGKLYVAKHFDEASKATMDELVHYLIEAYRESITNLTWMSDETKQRAIAKLEKFVPKIGYPVKWRDYSDLQVTDSHFANGRAAAVFAARIEFAKLGKPVDREEWFMTPQTVNAYYNPGMNEIVFPAAILQSPFFDRHVDAASNFGAIGAVIGHEIGHGFDDQGSQYDGDGQLQNWWTDADRTAFVELTKSLIAQYDELSPEGADGQTVNGELTIGENIGDLGGLSIAWKAYQMYLGGAPAPVLDGLSGAERFFMSWAQCWQQKARPAETVRLLTIDPHSPNEFRCNQIVRNLPIFHETFGTKEGDALWLDPAARVAIW